MQIFTKTPPDWMRSPAIETIFAAFPDDSLRFVGGCVRNALWDEPIGDIDLATQLTPPEMLAVFNAADIKAVPTGIDHGTITAVLESQNFEITSLRKDVETDGRRAVIAFTQDWAQDAQRRDFTVNALYADYDGQIYDPTGQGLADIGTRKFRFINDAEQRVREDYLRILRLFRFMAQYGGAEKFDAKALTACRENRAGLRQLSAERIWSEMKKILGAHDPYRVLHIMLTNDILEIVLKQASNVDGLAHLITLEHHDNIAPDPLLRLMAMSPRDFQSMDMLCSQLKMSKAERNRLCAWAKDEGQITVDMDEKDQLALIYKSGKQVVMDRAILRAAGVRSAVADNDAADARQIERFMALARLALEWQRPEFPITGSDLSQAGLENGPQMGKAMKALEALWIRSGFKTQKPQLLAALKFLGY